MRAKGLEHFVLQIFFKKGAKEKPEGSAESPGCSSSAGTDQEQSFIALDTLWASRKHNPQGIYPQGKEERNKNPAELGSASFSVLFHSLLHQQVSLWALLCSSREGNESFTQMGKSSS